MVCTIFLWRHVVWSCWQYTLQNVLTNLVPYRIPNLQHNELKVLKNGLKMVQSAYKSGHLPFFHYVENENIF